MRLGTLTTIVTLELILTQITASLSSSDLTNLKKVYARSGDPDFALDCPIANPGFHSVLWILHEYHILIGASVNYDHDKYRYLASTGQLLIKNVSLFDSGIFRCIAKIRKEGGRLEDETSAVELIVKRSYTNLWEEEYKDNIIRGSISGGMLIVVLILISLIYKLRYKKPVYQRQNSISSVVFGAGENPPGEIGRRDPGDGRDNLGMESEESGRKASFAPPPTSKDRGDMIYQPDRRQSRRESTNSLVLRRLSVIALSTCGVPEPPQAERLDSLPVTLGAVLEPSEASSVTVDVGVETETPGTRTRPPGPTVIYVTKD